MKRRFQRFLQTPEGKWLKAFAGSLLVFSLLISVSLVYAALCTWLAIAVGAVLGAAGSVSDFSSQYAYRIDAIKAMAHKQANAPDVLLELVTEQQFQAWLNKQSA